MEHVFKDGDFVNLHARLTDETRGFIGREHFDLMKPTVGSIGECNSPRECSSRGAVA
jgi:D-3-phosphoglycerate dehydrogenase / 2-oxoglutarate reductase